MPGTIRKVEITPGDPVVIESRRSSRRSPKIPGQVVRRAGCAAVRQYPVIRTRQPVRAGSPLIVERIEVAAH